ncbi:hypothetical protein QG033_01040, partial [Kingella kingae]|nr:hypothetical protein [Kingella kingae]
RCTRRSLSPCPNLNLIHYMLWRDEKCRLLFQSYKAACTISSALWHQHTAINVQRLSCDVTRLV